MNRREFLTTSAYIGSAIAIGATVPRAFLGDPAGGFYAAIPTDLRPYLREYGPIQPWNQDAVIQRHSLMALWAPPGAKFAAYAMFAGTTRIDYSRHELAAMQLVNRNDSMRACLERHHEPGWFLATESRPTGELDAEGDPVLVTEHKWKRCGYLKWLTVAEADKLSRGPFVVEAA